MAALVAMTDAGPADATRVATHRLFGWLVAQLKAYEISVKLSMSQLSSSSTELGSPRMGFCLLPRAGRRPRPHHVCRLSPRAGAGRTFATGCSASCGRRLTAASPGYEDVNDAERLARDPAMRAIVGRVGLDRPAASSSEMGRFETRWLATEANASDAIMRRRHADRGENHDPTGTAYYRQGRSMRSLTHHKRRFPHRSKVEAA